MIKFTTPCFVRVENVDEREELVKWCTDIGYHFIATPKEHEYGECVVCDEECVGYAVLSHVDEFSNCYFIDCGNDVELFKSLAAMNDEKDRDQWFVNDVGFWHKASGDKSICWTKDEHNVKHFCRKATVEEIVEHFKNKK